MTQEETNERIRINKTIESIEDEIRILQAKIRKVSRKDMWVIKHQMDFWFVLRGYLFQYEYKWALARVVVDHRIAATHVLGRTANAEPLWEKSTTKATLQRWRFWATKLVLDQLTGKSYNMFFHLHD